MCRFLKSLGIKGEARQAPLLDIVFGADGLIKAEDKKDLKKRWKNAEGLISELESQLKEGGDESFFKYLKDRENSFEATDS